MTPTVPDHLEGGLDKVIRGIPAQAQLPGHLEDAGFVLEVSQVDTGLGHIRFGVLLLGRQVGLLEDNADPVGSVVRRGHDAIVGRRVHTEVPS